MLFQSADSGNYRMNLTALVGQSTPHKGIQVFQYMIEMIL